jgi:glutathione peroxidase
MKLNIVTLSILFLSIFTSNAQENKSGMNFYQFNAKTLQGKEVSMKSYEGKVVLVVNVASKCGFTPQYEGLEALYKKYNSNGLVVLGFPCNQFAGQEPGSAEEIAKFCSLTYGVNFPMFGKIEVNGDNADPLFKYLKKALPGTLTNDVKWNFTKFLLDRNGKPVKRYAPTVKPEEITDDIVKLLAEK